MPCFGDRSIADAVSLVAQAGIEAFEFWAWWEKDLDELVAVADRNQMTIAACCTKFVSLVDPATRGLYLAGLGKSIAAAKKLNCRTLISQVGDLRTNVSRQEQQRCLIDGLRAAATMLAPTDVTLVIEPLNILVDHPGYFLVRSDEAFEIVDQVACPQIKVVFDIYHQQISEGHLIHNITTNMDKIGHFHAAGNPGRHELTIGEIDYPSVFDAIRQSPYNGFVGLEYWPINPPVEGLKQVADWLA